MIKSFGGEIQSPIQISIEDVLDLTQGRLVRRGSESQIFSDLSLISDASPYSICLLFQSTFLKSLHGRKPGVLLVAPDLIDRVVEAIQKDDNSVTSVIEAKDSSQILAKLTHVFQSIYPQWDKGSAVGVHPSAKIGKGTRIHPQVWIGPDVEIGENCEIFPMVSIYPKTVIGNRVRIHSGSVIGADGFGYAPRLERGVPTGHHKIFHLGGVQIGSDVEIGANTCIDRGTLGSTKISDSVKIDNQVQIGHNCEIGEGSILCGQVGIAGSTKVGKYVILGGKAGVSNGVTIGDYAQIGGMTAVTGPVLPGQKIKGDPMRPVRDHIRLQALLSRMLKRSRED